MATGCGWFGFEPKCIQRFRSIKWVLFFLCFGPCLQGILVNGMFHYFVSTIERNFGFQSVELGAISGAYDIAILLCMIPVTCLGGLPTAHKPRWIGSGVIIMGVGALVFSSPAFMDNRILIKNHPELCVSKFRRTLDKEEPSPKFEANFWLLFVGNLLHGVGASPIFTLGVTYLDENIPNNKSSIYIGIYFTMALIGPGLGFLAGANLIKLDTDFLHPGQRGSPNSPSFVGCWWLGFFIIGWVCFIVSIPIFGLPKSLSGEENEGSITTPGSTGESLRNLPRGLLELVTQHTFILLCLAMCCEGVLMSGFSVFLPKLLEYQFGISVTNVAIFLGSVVIPSALLGTVLGGWLVYRFAMEVKNILVFCLINVVLALVTFPALLIPCSKENFVGINIPYPGNTSQHWIIGSLKSPCNEYCECDPDYYRPICTTGNLSFFSSCFAGCKKSIVVEGTKVFYECGCLPKTKTGGNAWALEGMCRRHCPLFPLFTVLILLNQFFTFCSTIPTITATLRSVKKESNTLAIGVQSMLARLLGTLPGPLIIGSVIDQNCIRWEYSGACIIYDYSTLSMYSPIYDIFKFNEKSAMYES